MKVRAKGIRKLSRVLAGAFLALLVLEFASHGMICSNQHHSDETSMYATDFGHDDPCQTMVMCSPSRQRDQQQPRFGHDTVQHNGLSGTIDPVAVALDSETDSRDFYSDVSELIRPPDPHFQPPEIA